MTAGKTVCFLHRSCAQAMALSCIRDISRLAMVRLGEHWSVEFPSSAMFSQEFETVLPVLALEINSHPKKICACCWNQAFSCPHPYQPSRLFQPLASHRPRGRALWEGQVQAVVRAQEGDRGAPPRVTLVARIADPTRERVRARAGACEGAWWR